MEILAVTKLNLKPLALPYEYSFAWSRKKDRSKYWFTPSGKAKIWFGGLNIEVVGKITDKEYDSLVAEMKAKKVDALYNDTGHYTDVQNPYTITNDGIVRVTNLNEILVLLGEEFEAKKEYEGWKDL